MEAAMSRKKTVSLLSILLLVCVAAGVGLDAAWPRSPINRENAAQLVPGLPLAEVERILGGPARNDATGPITTDPTGHPSDGPLLWRTYAYRMRSLWDRPRETKEWWSNTLVVRVDLDGDARVERCECIAVRRINESPLDMIRRWLNL
jgi:hypothetical protein